ncbi:Bifunctional purine biosynthesis protein PurH [Kickxella alabastrina]|uniref:Bifunctional purine biosynthesis protein PurH n=1 Tax=Kickxella alabastrina TaxID=61397 RepID=A0ACC1ID38_9FUNG|nr:Bifunctional purine biosynthesis protein PurH [Kickxella alabastrina]
MTTPSNLLKENDHKPELQSRVPQLDRHPTNLPNSTDIGLNTGVILSSVAAALSSLNFGWCLGEPNIPEDVIRNCIKGPQNLINGLPTCLPMGHTMWGLFVGLVALGALVGSLVAGRAADQFGRKYILLVNNVFFITGALLLGTSTTFAQLAVGRFVSGIGCGVASTVVATYNSECAPVKVRGLIGTFLQFSVEVGIFLAQLIAVFLVDVPNWRILFGLSGVISIVQLAWLPFMPESPKFLIAHGMRAEAARALQFLRPNHDISIEFQAMLDLASGVSNAADDGHIAGSVDKISFVPDSSSECDELPSKPKTSAASISSVLGTNAPTSVGLVAIFKGQTPDTIWHLLFCTMFLMGFQQWTGTKGIVFYSTGILAKMFSLSPTQLRETPNTAQWVTIGLAATGIIAVLSSMSLIDRLGRRRLLLISTSGLAMACLLIVIGCAYNVPVLAVLAMFAFKLTYGLGMAPIPWLMASEMLPYYTLGTLSGIASALNWTMIFVVGLLFPALSRLLGDYLFVPFAALNFCAFVVILLMVPETKNRHISDILFHHGKRIHIVFSMVWKRRSEGQV